MPGQTPRSPRISCPLCGSDDHTVISRYGGLWNHRLTNVACRACGFVFRNPPWGPQETTEFYRFLSRYYVQEYGTDRLQDDFAPRYAQADARRAAWIGTYLAAGARLLDVGAGNGCLIAAANAAGFEAEGVELDEDAAADAQRRGQPVHLVPFEQVTWADGTFAAVTMIDVLEHCADLRVFLRQAWRLVPEGGLLFVEVPDITTLHMKLEYLLVPEHNWHFTARTLRYLLGQEGWQVEDEQIIPEPYDAANGVAVVARKTHPQETTVPGAEEYERVLAHFARARREVRLTMAQRLRDGLTRALGPRGGMALYRPLIQGYVGLKRLLGLYRDPAPPADATRVT
jgi:2-polyprenyl-3-methyl-5-hydroxy-6-metoxy-1,4-benzoquinol methylase